MTPAIVVYRHGGTLIIGREERPSNLPHGRTILVLRDTSGNETACSLTRDERAALREALGDQ